MADQRRTRRARTVWLDDDEWLPIRRQALDGHTTSSAIVETLIRDHLHTPPLVQAEVIQRAALDTGPDE